jgi:hypothetical protein
MLIIALQLFLILVGLTQSRQARDSHFSGWLTLFCFSLYIFITGLRWKTGTDWIPYEEAFNLTLGSSSDEFGTTFEPGYVLLIKIASAISDSFSVLLIIQSSVIAYFIFKTARYLQLPPVMLLASLLMIQSQFWYPVRQQISVSLIAFTFSALVVTREPKVLLTLSRIGVACMVHISAMATLPILVFLRKKRRLLSLGLGFLLVVATLYLFREVIFNYVGSRIFTYIIENAYEPEVERRYMRIAERALSFLISIYLIKNIISLKFTSNLSNLLYAMITFGFIISITALLWFPYLTRIALYFNWAEAVVFAGSIRHALRASLSIKIVIVLWFSLLAAKFLGSLYSYWDLLHPYYFMFEDVDRSVY